VIGNPLGLEHTLTNGIISARRIYEGERFIQMSAPISPGNSGGPVFDRHGRVIGVSVAHLIGGQNLNFAVPVSQLQALIAEDYPNRRGFGTSSW
jgi:S1-C subfamily serine protease